MTIEEYLDERYAPTTASAYSRDIRVFVRYCPDAAKARYRDIIAYLGALRKQKLATATLHRWLAAIKVYYDYLCDAGIRDDHPAASITLRDQVARDIQLQDLFTTEELEGLLERPERFSALVGRNKVLTSLLIYQALLPRELAALTTEVMNLEKGRVSIQGTATTAARELFLKPNQILLFQEYLHEIRPQLLRGYATTLLLISHRGTPMTAHDIIKHVRRSFAGRYPGRSVTVQTIRQSVITNLLVVHDLALVQRFAGHKYPSSTERYKQTEVETLQVAVNKYHPIK